jgi:hypothetical protein
MSPVAVVVSVIVLGGLGYLIFVSNPRRGVRWKDMWSAETSGQIAYDRELHDAWTNMRDGLHRSSTADVFRVGRVYQVARTGTKAFATSLKTGDEQDAWFEGITVQSGSYVLVNVPTSGWGRHNNWPNVLYVHTADRHGYLPPGTAEAAERHQKRLVNRNT